MGWRLLRRTICRRIPGCSTRTRPWPWPRDRIGGSRRPGWRSRIRPSKKRWRCTSRRTSLTRARPTSRTPRSRCCRRPTPPPTTVAFSRSATRARTRSRRTPRPPWLSTAARAGPSRRQTPPATWSRCRRRSMWQAPRSRQRGRRSTSSSAAPTATTHTCRRPALASPPGRRAPSARSCHDLSARPCLGGARRPLLARDAGSRRGRLSAERSAAASGDGLVGIARLAGGRVVARVAVVGASPRLDARRVGDRRAAERDSRAGPAAGGGGPCPAAVRAQGQAGRDFWRGRIPLAGRLLQQPGLAYRRHLLRPRAARAGGAAGARLELARLHGRAGEGDVRPASRQPPARLARHGRRALLDRLRQADGRRSRRCGPFRAAGISPWRDPRQRRRDRSVHRRRARISRFSHAEVLRPRGRGRHPRLRVALGNHHRSLGRVAGPRRRRDAVISKVSKTSMLVLAVGFASGAACAGHAKGHLAAPPALWVGALVPAATSREGLLTEAGEAVWRGDLAAAEVALTALADRERGRPDSALDFWSEMLALLRCEPLARVPHVYSSDPPLRDPWEQLRRLVQIERVRLARARPEPPKTTRTMARTSARSDGRANGSGAAAEVTTEVSWPIEREHWNDEVAVPLLVTRCPLANSVTSPVTSPATSIGTAPAADAEIALVAGTAGMLPPEHPATAPLLLQAAVLEMAHGRAAPAVAALARFDAAGGARDNALALRERSDAIFTDALAAIGDPAVSPNLAMEKSRAAFRLDLPASVRRSLALLLADRLVAAKRPDDAVAILGAPPHGDDAIGRYIAFRQVEAHARAGRRAELLAEAREALHRHGHADVDADPALGAMMDLALRALEASPVSSETMEVLEALGPPRERLSRAQAFSEMALGAGAHASAMATFAWLYDNDTDSARKLQHLARESVAAARAGARAEFARTFLLLAGQEEPAARPTAAKAKANAKTKTTATTTAGDGGMIASEEANGRRSKLRAERSVDWQRALLVVARDALPALVDNDDQTDLGTLVATLKRHLDEAGRGPVDEELTTLYRAASAHLRSGPRAYAETVGSARRPILLGEILIGRNYDVRAPIIDLTSALEETGPLVFVPRRGADPTPSSLRRWPGSFRIAWTGGGS